MNSERIIAHAEIAACYFRSLVEKGVPVTAAVSLTSTYVQSVQFIDAGKEAPKEPWEGS